MSGGEASLLGALNHPVAMMDSFPVGRGWMEGNVRFVGLLKLSWQAALSRTRVELSPHSA